LLKESRNCAFMSSGSFYVDDSISIACEKKLSRNSGMKFSEDFKCPNGSFKTYEVVSLNLSLRV
jgi:hypothetical protein